MKNWIAYLALVLASVTAAAQTNQGPFNTPQMNSIYFVGSLTGGAAQFYPTIQSAVTAACAAGTHNVVDIPPAYTGSDPISGVTGGCTTTSIRDEHNGLPNACYTWQTSVYSSSGISCSASSGSVTPGGTTGAAQYNNAGALGGLNGTGLMQLNGTSAPTIATSAQLATQLSATPQAITVASCSGCGGSSLPTATAAGQVPISTAAGTTYAAGTSVPTFSVKNLNNVHYANQWCTTPGTLDDTCFSNAIADIVANGPTQFDGTRIGTILVPPGTYTFGTQVTVPTGTHITISGTQQTGLWGSQILAGSGLTGGAFLVESENAEIKELAFINTTATTMSAITLQGHGGTQPDGTFDTHINWCWFAWKNVGIHVVNAGGLDLSHNTFDSGTSYGIYSNHSAGDVAANDIIASDLRGYGGLTEVLLYGDAANPTYYQADHFSGIFDNGIGASAIDLRNVNNASVSGTFNSNAGNDINLNADIGANIGPINTYATGSTSIVDTGSTGTHIFAANFINPNATDTSNTRPVILATNTLNLTVSGSTSTQSGGTALPNYGLKADVTNTGLIVYGNNFQAQVTAPYNVAATVAPFEVLGQVTAAGEGSAGPLSAFLATYAGAAGYAFQDTAAGTDAKNWDFFANGNTLSLRALNDAAALANNIMVVTRSGYAISSIALGGAVTAPSIGATTPGTGAFTTLSASTSITDTSLGASLPICTNSSSGLATSGCNIATLGASQTFSGAVVFTGSANFTTGSFGVNAVGFYVTGSTSFSIAQTASFEMAPANATATGSNNYSSVEGYYVTAYWQGSASTEGAFQSIANPASGSNPLITFNHTFNANFGLGTGGTAIGQELWAYPVGLKVYTVATLPTASAYSPGDMVAVSDDMTLGVTCAGGGTNYAIAITNGSTWTCH